jgi:hypothetical protein
LRRELREYSETHNDHRIRPQKERPNHQPGVLNELYFGNPDRQGFLPDEELLCGLEEAMSDISKLQILNTKGIDL